MPPLEAEQIKSKTALVNLPQVASALRCAPDVLAAFICIPLGTTYKCDSKAGKPTWLLKAAFTQSKLQERIHAFCAECVVCPKCGDCGTRLYALVSGKGKRATRQCRMRCGACGADERAVCQETRVAKLLPDESELRAPLKLVSSSTKLRTEPQDMAPPTSTENDNDSHDPFADVDFSAEAIRARESALCSF